MKDEVSGKKWVLYIGQDIENPEQFCMGSRESLRHIKPIEEDCLIQNVDSMLDEKVDLPDWMDGTPIFVSILEKKAWKGTDAINKIKEAGSVISSKRQEKQEISGVLPPGEKFLHESDDASLYQHTEKVDESLYSDKKITEEDVKKFQEEREKRLSSRHPT